VKRARFCRRKRGEKRPAIPRKERAGMEKNVPSPKSSPSTVGGGRKKKETTQGGKKSRKKGRRRTGEKKGVPRNRRAEEKNRPRASGHKVRPRGGGQERGLCMRRKKDPPGGIVTAGGKRRTNPGSHLLPRGRSVQIKKKKGKRVYYLGESSFAVKKGRRLACRTGNGDVQGKKNTGRTADPGKKSQVDSPGERRKKGGPRIPEGGHFKFQKGTVPVPAGKEKIHFPSRREGGGPGKMPRPTCWQKEGAAELCQVKEKYARPRPRKGGQ